MRVHGVGTWWYCTSVAEVQSLCVYIETGQLVNVRLQNSNLSSKQYASCHSVRDNMPQDVKANSLSLSLSQYSP